MASDSSCRDSGLYAHPVSKTRFPPARTGACRLAPTGYAVDAYPKAAAELVTFDPSCQVAVLLSAARFGALEAALRAVPAVGAPATHSPVESATLGEVLPMAYLVPGVDWDCA